MITKADQFLNLACSEPIGEVGEYTLRAHTANIVIEGKPRWSMRMAKITFDDDSVAYFPVNDD